jgi:hypothetical protein
MAPSSSESRCLREWGQRSLLEYTAKEIQILRASTESQSLHDRSPAALCRALSVGGMMYRFVMTAPVFSMRLYARQWSRPVLSGECR